MAQALPKPDFLNAAAAAMGAIADEIRTCQTDVDSVSSCASLQPLGPLSTVKSMRGDRWQLTLPSATLALTGPSGALGCYLKEKRGEGGASEGKGGGKSEDTTRRVVPRTTLGVRRLSLFNQSSAHQIHPRERIPLCLCSLSLRVFSRQAVSAALLLHEAVAETQARTFLDTAPAPAAALAAIQSLQRSCPGHQAACVGTRTGAMLRAPCRASPLGHLVQ